MFETIFSLLSNGSFETCLCSPLSFAQKLKTARNLSFIIIKYPGQQGWIFLHGHDDDGNNITDSTEGSRTTK